MRYLKLFALFIISILIFKTESISQNKRPLELEDMFRIKRVTDPQLSPDGRWIAYVVTEVNKAENKSNSDLYLISSTGGDPKRLTTSSSADNNPRWSPDSKTIAFISTRSGDGQIWLIDIYGGEARQLTKLSTGASNPMWSPDGKMLAFASSVYPEFSDKPFKESDELNKKKNDDKEKSKVKARIFTKLLYRHWNAWVDGKRLHIFVMQLENGETKDITPGDRDAFPTSSTFSAGDDFAFSPDGKEIAYTTTPTENEAWNTNHDIYTVSIGGN